MTFGEKIQKLRKKQGLSQEALAEKVTVTRQTISKWELNQSTPDLDFIAQLSNIFGVSADYLIKEELVEPDTIVVPRKKIQFTERGRKIAFFIVSIIALIAICACLICEYFITKRLSWSLIVATSVVVAWCILLPLFIAKAHIITRTLTVVSIITIPFLAVLSLLLDCKLIITMGTCIAVVGILTAWLYYYIYRKFHMRIWRCCAFAVLCEIPITVIINLIVCWFLEKRYDEVSNRILDIVIALIASVACFGVDYYVSTKKE